MRRPLQSPALINAFYDSLRPEQRDTAQAMQKAIQAVAPHLRPEVKWGNLCFMNDNDNIMAIVLQHLCARLAVATGRDLAALKAQLGEAAQLTFSDTNTGIEREGIKVWDFGDLPPTITFTRGGRQVTGYPALADEGDSVAIRLKMSLRNSSSSLVKPMMLTSGDRRSWLTM